jgi:ubiquinone/menaquinone biosynthesis C-methylase UbiE
VDVGGGASLLVDRLLDQGFTNLTVTDVSARALSLARERLGERSRSVRWIVADVRQAALAPSSVDLWHDRAVFHFLTTPTDRRAYVEQMSRALRAGGHAVIATFALEGPAQCSGLAVSRYSAATLAYELGPGFELLDSTERTHVTPSNREQRFTYTLFRKRTTTAA